MIWSGLELSARSRAPGLPRRGARDGAKAVAADLADPARRVRRPAGRERHRRAARRGDVRARHRGARRLRPRLDPDERRARRSRTATPDGSFGRFFDGPPPRTTVTAWQTNGGLALEIAAAALDPAGATPTATPGRGAAGPRSRRPDRRDPLPRLGDRPPRDARRGCCEPGHARVLVDGRETFDGTGIWQNKSSSGKQDPRHGPLRLALAEPGAHTISLRAGHSEREGRRLVPARAGVPRAALTAPARLRSPTVNLQRNPAATSARSGRARRARATARAFAWSPSSPSACVGPLPSAPRTAAAAAATCALSEAPGRAPPARASATVAAAAGSG